MTKREDQTASPQEITRLLHAWRDSKQAEEDLVPVVYDELKRLASRRLRRERAEHTMQTVDLVHEAYLRMVDQRQTDWQDRGHFFAVAAQAMRRVLIDHARRRSAAKRIDANLLVPLENAIELGVETDFDILALDEALNRLATLDAEQARIVELRAFAGLTLEETAELVERPRTSVWREWSTAKLWLRREMGRVDPQTVAGETRGPEA